MVARENPKVHTRKGTQPKEPVLGLQESRLKATTNDSRDGGYGGSYCTTETGGLKLKAPEIRHFSTSNQVCGRPRIGRMNQRLQQSSTFYIGREIRSNGDMWNT